MGLTYQKKIPIGKNLNLNVSKSGVSFSFKIPGIGSLNLRNGKLTFNAGKAGFRLRETLNKKPKATKAKAKTEATPEEVKPE